MYVHVYIYMYNVSICYSTATEVEGLVRSHGVVPATIGILEGKIHIGKHFHVVK